MTPPLRIAILGLGHDHIWDHLDDLLSSAHFDLVGAADADSALRDKLQGKATCPLWSDWRKLLGEVDLDAVFIYAANREGAEVATECARRGLHVMIEKPMAADHAGACEMRDAAEEAGTVLMINWPFAWWPQMQEAITQLEGGLIGRVWQVKYRAAHAGPAELGCSPQFCEWLFDENKNGGGAMMDYCCYGTTLTRALLGQPDEVFALTGNLCKTDIAVEDNAIIVMRTATTMATAEASWTQIGKLTSYTTAIYGTNGTLVIEPRAGGRLLLATDQDPTGSPLTLDKQPSQLKNPTEHFAHVICHPDDMLLLCRPDICCDSQQILQAGRISSEEGRIIPLPLAP